MASPRSSLLVLPAAGALLSSLLLPLATGTASAAPSARGTATTLQPGCPVPLPTSQVRAGMLGRGLTVVKGRTPEQFRVEVLGTMTDALGPDRDLILIQVRDLPGRTVIGDRGIWAGMSGSPVYVNGKFLGAIGYGFSAAGRIGGVTPAEDMLRLLSPQKAAKVVAAPQRVPVTSGAREQLPSGARNGSFERLPMPLGISGLSPRRLGQYRSASARADAPVVPYAAGSSRAGVSGPRSATLRPGGNFAAALAYGDISAAAVGTTSVVCGGQALAFAHPFTFAGPVSFGAHDAEAVAIVRSTTQGSFKLANLHGLAGTVDQDRGAAIRATLGTAPRTIPVRSAVSIVDQKRKRVGGMSLTDSPYLPPLTAFGLMGAYDTTADRVGGGSAKVTWTIKGARADGRPFAVTRSDRWASASDIAYEPAVDLAITLDALLNNPYERVRLTSVNYAISATSELRRMRLVSAVVSVNGGAFRSPREMSLRSGDRLRVRTTLQPYQSSALVVVEQTVRVPAGMSGRSGALRIEAGGLTGGEGSSASCLFDADGCAGGAEGATTIDHLLADIRSRPGNDVLEATLELDGDMPEDPPVVRTAVKRMPQVVTGARYIAVEVR